MAVADLAIVQIDMRLIPWLSLLYLLAFLDRMFLSCHRVGARVDVGSCRIGYWERDVV